MNGKPDANNAEASRDSYVAALKRERAHYVATGQTDRLEAVDAELARVGAGADPVERAVSAAPERAEAVKSTPARRKPAARKAKS
jgi:hypothetical protein